MMTKRCLIGLLFLMTGLLKASNADRVPETINCALLIHTKKHEHYHEHNADVPTTGLETYGDLYAEACKRLRVSCDETEFSLIKDDASAREKPLGSDLDARGYVLLFKKRTDMTITDRMDQYAEAYPLGSLSRWYDHKDKRAWIEGLFALNRQYKEKKRAKISRQLCLVNATLLEVPFQASETMQVGMLDYASGQLQTLSTQWQALNQARGRTVDLTAASSGLISERFRLLQAEIVALKKDLES